MMKTENMTYTLAFWLIRIWIGVRCLFTGLVKFQGKVTRVKIPENPTPEDIEFAKEMQAMLDSGESVPANMLETVQTLGFSNYNALPQGGPMSVSSFKTSPLMLDFMVGPYAWCLGFALVGLGLMLLLGVCTRVTLFLIGLMFVSLSYGFIILEKTLGESSAAGAAYMGVHMLLVVAGLMLAKYNMFELLPCRKLPCCKLFCSEQK